MSATNQSKFYVADQRYYHFVVLREIHNFTLKSYWRSVGDVSLTARSEDGTDDQYHIQHRKLRSSMSFARGAVAERLSEKGEGRPPYLYDLFAAKFSVQTDTYLLFGFPFIGLASLLISGLISEGRLLHHGELVGVDVQNLVLEMESGKQPRFEKLQAHIVGVQFSVVEDKSLSAVRLGGDDPLGAAIYRKYLRERRDKGECMPNRCVLACEREWGDNSHKSEKNPIPRAYRSRVHVDGHGNFKFYAHTGCSNVGLMPYVIGQLRAMACLRKVTTNPLLHQREDED